MLQIKNICKQYKTGSLVQKALDNVSLNLRDNEFVAILGPSGSGKTTLLNIIGGLDRYDSGDLIINGISTKKYKDRDWDSYRNHTIGFVFQSYNLIPHQTVLSNVELALTISGISKAERRERARKALEKVGLGEQLHKKPNQMSGGQMQRVAIARALVNNPDILLADEPTGALDSDTSIQVMELLREVARDRLVVMVTHSPELADAYANRIVSLRDGSIRSDTNPFEVDEAALEEPEHKNMGKASMSFLTALSLSFNNLKTKKARTLLTAFAGSIGIIGIALILSLSNGVNSYIQSVEEETLSEYPLEIQSTGVNLSSMMESDTAEEEQDSGQVRVRQIIADMFSTMDTNDLESLKEYFDSEESGIGAYTNAVEYSYSVTPQIYRQEDDGEARQVNPDRSFEAMGFGSASGSNSLMSAAMSTDIFYEMPQHEELYKDQYEVKAGRWPKSYNECVVVLTSDGSISDFMLYTLGLRDPEELDEMIRQFIEEEDIEAPEDTGTYSYDDIVGIQFKLVDSADYYEYDSEYEVWRDKTDNSEYMKRLVGSGEDITVVGIVQPAEDVAVSMLSTGIGYPSSLTEHVVSRAEEKEIVQEQIKNKELNVFTGERFGEESDGSFDMATLFTVDAGALQEAFGFDESKLTSGMTGSFDIGSGEIDLSGMADLGSVTVELPDVPELKLGDLMSGFDLTVSPDALTGIAASLLEGYKEYAASNPEADFTNLAEDVTAYLNSAEGQAVLSSHIMDIIRESGIMSVSSEQLQQLAVSVMTGFREYAVNNGMTDVSQFDAYLQDYMQTPEAQQILSEWAAGVFQNVGDITITTEQIQSLAADLAAGYQQYAAANGMADPSRMGEYFLAYLQTEDASRRVADGLTGEVDTESLRQQISSALETYMQEVMTSYGESLGSALESQINSAMAQVMSQIGSSIEDSMTDAVRQLGNNIQDAMNIDAEAFANAIQFNMDGDELMELLMSMSSSQEATYSNNLQTLGYADFDQPSSIRIYPKDFESKEEVIGILDGYNARMEAEGKEEQVITYTDLVGTLMSSVTDIIDIISYVLIAFVAISLVVSSIMIGVITYISVLERKKEIGILRAIGASKSNVSQVFNAETFIIGLCAGVMGIVITLILLIPGNQLIHYLAGRNDINAVLPAAGAVILILLSVVLTLIGGLIPSSKAAKSDPVTALRVE